MKCFLFLPLMIGCTSVVSGSGSPDHLDAQELCDQWALELSDRILACGGDQQKTYDWLMASYDKCSHVVGINPLADPPETCIEAAETHSCDPASFIDMYCAAFLTIL